MTTTITEYAGSLAYGRGTISQSATMQEPALLTTPITIGSSVSTTQLGANTRIVRISVDSGAFILFTSSGSTVICTSTNAARYGVGDYIRGVSPFMKITTLST